MFIVAETHPFNDGNGHLARITMSTYLTAGHVEPATQTLTSTNAFEDADQGHRIKMPDTSLTPRT